MESAYTNQALPERYDETLDSDRLQMHREAMQRLNAFPARSRSDVSRSYTSSATEQASNAYKNSDSETKLNGPLLHTESVAATCVSCMSSSSLVNIDKSLFCSTCNRSALLPRIS